MNTNPIRCTVFMWTSYFLCIYVLCRALHDMDTLGTLFPCFCVLLPIAPPFWTNFFPVLNCREEQLVRAESSKPHSKCVLLDFPSKSHAVLTFWELSELAGFNFIFSTATSQTLCEAAVSVFLLLSEKVRTQLLLW